MTWQAGAAFRCPKIEPSKRHIHFVLCEGLSTDARLVVVNFTTSPAHGCPSLRVTPSEYVELTASSSMLAFGHMSTPTPDHLVEAEKSGLLVRAATPVPALLLAKIQQSALASDETERRTRTLLVARLNPAPPRA